MKTVSSNISNVGPQVDRASNPAVGNGDKSGGADFLGQLQALQISANMNSPVAAKPAASELKFSNHAIDRMQARGIAFNPTQMAKIQNAVEKAASKGGKNTLLLSDDSALIVNVKDRTVVTVMDKMALKENVFTNIDSTVMI
jgi:flagellar operon protein